MSLSTQALLLFLVVLLIGVGYGFVKTVLSSNEKKLFALVLSLQVVANIATIIIEETSEGSRRHSTWRSISLLVDLICCAAIIFPIMWSIKVGGVGADMVCTQILSLQTNPRSTCAMLRRRTARRR